MEPLEFKKFANVLGRTAISDPLRRRQSLRIPIFAVIYYFVAFGFNRWWFTAGIVAWIIGSAITKVTTCPSISGSGSRRMSTPISYGRGFTRSRWGTRGAPGSRFFLSS